MLRLMAACRVLAMFEHLCYIVKKCEFVIEMVLQSQVGKCETAMVL
jgi:hypothetical protein